jgi:hypothetical protein
MQTYRRRKLPGELTSDELQHRLYALRYHVGRLGGAIDLAFEPGMYHDPAAIDCKSTEYPLKIIACVIDDVLGTFDELQRDLGERYPRHAGFLTGGRDET